MTFNTSYATGNDVYSEQSQSHSQSQMIVFMNGFIFDGSIQDFIDQSAGHSVKIDIKYFKDGETVETLDTKTLIYFDTINYQEIFNLVEELYVESNYPEATSTRIIINLRAPVLSVQVTSFRILGLNQSMTSRTLAGPRQPYTLSDSIDAAILQALNATQNHRAYLNLDDYFNDQDRKTTMYAFVQFNGITPDILKVGESGFGNGIVTREQYDDWKIQILNYDYSGINFVNAGVNFYTENTYYINP